MFEFCPKCGCILKPKKDEAGKSVLACSCGFEKSPGSSASMTDKKKEPEMEIEVVDGDIETLPITKEECPNCGNGEAYYWLVQTRAGDESETKFLKCTKCKHTWRDYS